MGRLSLLRTTAIAGALLTAGGIGACAEDSAGPDPHRVDVVTASYPLQFVAERVGGDAVAVTNLTKPGAEPHDVELSPGQVGQISEAELIVYLQGFQPAVDAAVEQEGGDRAFDVAEVQPLRGAAEHEHGGGDGREGDHGGKDPHVWLDTARLATISDRLAERLGEADPDNAAGYTERAGSLRAELEKLHQEYAERMKTCQRREIVVSHAAFGYLTDRYQLEQIAVSGLTPEAEPSPQRLAEVVEEAKQHRATTIFFESAASPKVAETIAREAGLRTAVLDPIEVRPDGDYFSVMRANLAALGAALECS